MRAASAAEPASQHYFAPGLSSLSSLGLPDCRRRGDGVWQVCGTGSENEPGGRRQDWASGSGRIERAVTSGGSRGTRADHGVCPPQTSGDANPGADTLFCIGLRDLISMIYRQVRTILEDPAGFASPASRRWWLVRKARACSDFSVAQGKERSWLCRAEAGAVEGNSI